ncbi:MAG: ABC transporter permease, partial [Microcystis aeruginosa]
LAFFTVMITPLWIYEIVVFSAAVPPVNIASVLLAHLGLILLAAAILAIGMFISSLTNSSILAYIITFITILFIWILDVIANNAETFFRDRIGGEVGEQIGFFLKELLSHLSWYQPFNNFVRGIFDSSSLVILLSYILLGIFLTTQAIEANRYQRN